MYHKWTLANQDINLLVQHYISYDFAGEVHKVELRVIEAMCEDRELFRPFQIVWRPGHPTGTTDGQGATVPTPHAIVLTCAIPHECSNGTRVASIARRCPRRSLRGSRGAERARLAIHLSARHHGFSVLPVVALQLDARQSGNNARGRSCRCDAPTTTATIAALAEAGATASPRRSTSIAAFS